MSYTFKKVKVQTFSKNLCSSLVRLNVVGKLCKPL